MILLKRHTIIPGFGLTLGFSLSYLGLVILIPLSMVFLKSAQLSFDELLTIIWSPRSVAAYQLSFGAAFIAAAINTIFGLLVAWVLVRYEFPFKYLIDATVDLPFALPTAVAGISLTYIYSANGWLGRYLAALGIQGAYSRLGVVIALTFIGLPFVVRTIQPVLRNLDPQIEEAAVCLGASRWQKFTRVLLPMIIPATLTGFALAFARAVGEYGSVIFISGNMPMRTEIVPLVIMTKLEEYDYPGATALAAFMLCVSFVMLFLINTLQWWSQRHREITN